jgi:hypothetical protein
VDARTPMADGRKHGLSSSPSWSSSTLSSSTTPPRTRSATAPRVPSFSYSFSARCTAGAHPAESAKGAFGAMRRRIGSEWAWDSGGFSTPTLPRIRPQNRTVSVALYDVARKTVQEPPLPVQIAVLELGVQRGLQDPVGGRAHDRAQRRLPGHRPRLAPAGHRRVSRSDRDRHRRCSGWRDLGLVFCEVDGSPDPP